jgi:hypothetical protein
MGRIAGGVVEVDIDADPVSAVGLGVWQVVSSKLPPRALARIRRWFIEHSHHPTAAQGGWECESRGMKKDLPHRNRSFQPKHLKNYSFTQVEQLSRQKIPVFLQILLTTITAPSQLAFYLYECAYFFRFKTADSALGQLLRQVVFAPVEYCNYLGYRYASTGSSNKLTVALW